MNLLFVFSLHYTRFLMARVMISHAKDVKKRYNGINIFSKEVLLCHKNYHIVQKLLE